MTINFEILVVVILYSFENLKRVHNFVKEDNPTHICSLWKSCPFLKRCHRLAVSDRCAICGQLETFSHVFCECTHSPAIWTWIVAILNKLHVTPLFSPRQDQVQSACFWFSHVMLIGQEAVTSHGNMCATAHRLAQGA